MCDLRVPFCRFARYRITTYGHIKINMRFGGILVVVFVVAFIGVCLHSLVVSPI